MTKLKVACLSLSLDGFAAGPDQNLEQPLGKGGLALHQWAFATAAFQKMHGGKGGETGIDNQFIEQGFDKVGAWIIGRNMFGPLRGPWMDESWRGWWGEEPPYHVPVFVLTHHPRPPLRMLGGTTFHFVADGIAAALEQARQAAHGQDIRLGGGADTIRQYLRAGLVDELHLAIAPALLGAGEPLLAGLDLPELGYRCSSSVSGERAAHFILLKD
ncbi:dihydrofolate reductase family protein [Chromobacterium sp. IIBBL 290-4]|uniref:dihydrofolate reductase family protein n=1 Tax=Chromobacterium sp. IIBBL 290-4 TaxID=2953890 RepID=UPI0020B86994|nr:dihydrofolate reductase family protein [Chromobacterium sp. IIBBL 290-4]UTH72779.1 dihydrofolate reductase family protein [Chromobacterium sp. IIBBL 290-4]